MTDHKILYLSEQDILDLKLEWEEIFSTARRALIEHGNKTVENPPKPGVHKFSNSFIHAMPAYLKEADIMGIKWVAGYPSNREKGLQVTTGLQILNDPNTGFPLCIMNATWTTMVRTAAVTAVAAPLCARADSEVLGVVGAGVQGTINTEVLCLTIPSIKKIKVYDIFPAASERFKAVIEEKTGLSVEVVADAETAVRDSDIVVTATQKLPEPFLKKEWLKPGYLGIPLDVSRAWSIDALFAADKFINDDLAQARLYEADGAFPAGIPTLYCHTGELLNGSFPGRTSDSEDIILMNIGLGIYDISLGHYIYEKAKAAGKGVYVNF
ncbi:MAG: ornithine cyclodeaminase family protein [Ruminococcaceae bacterium]|nr:ornithine cyclodeaminase family protein [Oscillospiraceae bacterium]